MTRMPLLEIAVIVTALAVGILPHEEGEILLNEEADECDLKESILFCDYAGSKKSVIVSSLGKDIRKVFVYNVQTIQFDGFDCLDVTIDGAVNIIFDEGEFVSCEKSCELSVKNSVINFIPNQVTHIYLEGAVLSSLVTSTAVTKLVAINSKISTFKLHTPLAPGTTAIVQNSEIESLQHLIVQDNSSLIFQKSKIGELKKSALNVVNADVILRDSSIETSQEDSIVLGSNSRLTLESFSGNLEISTSISLADDCEVTFYGVFIACLCLLTLSSILLVLVLFFYLRLRFIKRKKYVSSENDDKTPKENKEGDAEEPQQITSLLKPMPENSQSIIQSPPKPKMWSLMKYITPIPTDIITTNEQEKEGLFCTSLVLENLQKLNESLWESNKKHIKEKKKEVSNLHINMKNRVTEIEKHLKQTVKEYETEEGKKLYAIDKKYKNILYYTTNPLNKDILQRTKQVEKEEVQATTRRMIREKEVEAECETLECHLKITEEYKSIINSFIEEGHKYLTCLQTTRHTCKGSMGESEQYEEIFSIFGEELNKMLLDIRVSGGEQTEKSIRDILQGRKNALETLQNLNKTFNRNMQELDNEENNEIVRLKRQSENSELEKEDTKTIENEQIKESSKEESQKISDNLNIFYSLKRVVLKENFFLNNEKHFYENFENSTHLTNTKELLKFQDDQLESLQRIMLLVLNFHRRYIRGTTQLASSTK